MVISGMIGKSFDGPADGGILFDEVVVGVARSDFPAPMNIPFSKPCAATAPSRTENCFRRNDDDKIFRLDGHLHSIVFEDVVKSISRNSSASRSSACSPGYN
jgi:hypothetical protein